jgi:hypothetical protein
VAFLRDFDYEEYLILLYFGRSQDKFALCQRRAYADFQRTLRGIQHLPLAKDAKVRSGDALRQMFASIISMKSPTQKQFDDWHKTGCYALKGVYQSHGYDAFYIGHAQKWINMTFKYLYVMGETRVPGVSQLYDLCHVPFDEILISALREYGFKRLGCAWSRLDDYDVYLDRQCWVRSQFKLAPLDVEFHLWMGKPLPEPAQI